MDQLMKLTGLWTVSALAVMLLGAGSVLPSQFGIGIAMLGAILASAGLFVVEARRKELIRKAVVSQIDE